MPLGLNAWTEVAPNGERAGSWGKEPALTHRSWDGEVGT